jgi:hypothetical protein
MTGSITTSNDTELVAAERSFSASAERAARVMARKSPATQATYLGVYSRFGRWLADRDGVAEPDVRGLDVDSLIGYLDQLEARAAPSTVKKDRAALRALARYLHQLRVIDATEILMVEIPTVDDRLAVAPEPVKSDETAWW